MGNGRDAGTRRATKRELLAFVRAAIARGDLRADEEQHAVARLGELVRRFGLTRRDLLRASAASVGVTLIATEVGTRTGWAPSAAEAKTLLSATPSLTASVLRRDDMLALRFDFYNLVRDRGNLVRQEPAQPAYIVATLGHGDDHAPQNIAEQAFLETAPALTTEPATAGETLADPGTVQGILAGRTRLAFRVPDDLTSIPFTLDTLLDFARFQMSVAPAALPPLAEPATAPTIRAPEDTETALETPWHLTLSPHSGSTFAHAALPVVHNGRAELWHTRLAVRKPNGAGFVADETDVEGRKVRAIWADGFDIDTPPPTSDAGPFRMSLRPNDRYQIVRLSSDFSLNLVSNPDDRYLARAIDVDKLMLTALGAWQSTRGYFAEPAPGFNVGEWKHIATMARDQYVKVVYLGWLMPFGHPAALLKVTERKVNPVPGSSDRGGYLRQRFFIVVRQPVVSYLGQPSQKYDGRGSPYQSVEIRTTVTPTLDDPTDPNWDFIGKQDLAFFPVVSGQVFRFSLRGTDRDGITSEFTLPLAFVSYPVLGSLTDADIATIVEDYRDTAGCTNLTEDLKTATLGGQKVGVAESVKPGDATVEAKTMTFAAEPATGDVPRGHAPFYPTWAKAEVRLNAAEAVRGGALPSAVVVEPHPTYLDSGFDGKSDVFAKLATSVDLKFADSNNGDRSGGLANPDMKIGGLSRKLGPVGGDVTTLPTEFDPAKFFDGAKILGGILLSDIIENVLDFIESEVPHLKMRTIYPNDDTTRPPQAVEAKLHYEPKLHEGPTGVNIFKPDGDASMKLDATFLTPIDPPGEPSYTIVGDLRNFTALLIGDPLPLLSLHFNQLTFTAKNGKKPNVDVDIDTVEFEGVLSFVNTLKDFLKLGGTGPSIELLPTQVTAGFDLPIPTVGVGVLTIQNITFGAGVTVPFTGKPARVRANFSTREHPFLVTVIGLGGGGFFGIALGLDGMEMLEASIEVGASVALNLGVASGEVHAMAGLYYKLQRVEATDTVPEHDQAELTGFVRLGGSVNVLGIASVSVEFYLALTYEPSPANDLYGQASLTVEVEVLCFSKSFSFTVERRIAGSGSAGAASLFALSSTTAIASSTSTGLDFTDLMSQSDWNEYAAAFATA